MDNPFFYRHVGLFNKRYIRNEKKTGSSAIYSLVGKLHQRFSDTRSSLEDDKLQRAGNIYLHLR